MSDPAANARQLATAAWLDLHSAAQAYQAAVIRGVGPAELDAMRQACHDRLEVYLDLQAEAGVQVRSILGD